MLYLEKENDKHENAKLFRFFCNLLPTFLMQLTQATSKIGLWLAVD